uniref:Uncharacterized protein n=1 Tax=Quercus lobata TaxID=97700 RepID=A0A7N2N1A6_QUELO
MALMFFHILVYIAAVSAKPTFKHIPKKGVLVFDVAQFDGILKKITESNNDKVNDKVNSTLSGKGELIFD